MRSIELQELMAIAVDVRPVVDLGGGRRFVPFNGGTFTGRDGLAGTIVEGGIDWQQVRPDGVLEIDAHYTLMTDAGETVEVRHAGLLETGRFSDFFDRVNDAVREYLGARFGFDGLESTTDETLRALRRAPHFGLPLPELAAFLQDCDLVKFADVTPALEECERTLAQAERVVRTTMPATAARVPFDQEGVSA